MADVQRVPAAPRARWRDPLVLGVGAAAVAFAGVAATLAARFGRSTPDAFPVRTEITLHSEGGIGPGVLSPDGRSVVFTGSGAPGRPRRYYLRRLDQLTSREIPGTENAWRAPAFSPDGKWLAFNQGWRRLVKVPVEGGAPVLLTEVADYGGLDWAPNGEIILGFGIDEGLQGLHRINEAGGRLVPFTRVDTTRKELSHQSPRILADGKTVLFTIWFGSIERAELAITSLDDGKVVPIRSRSVSAASSCGVRPATSPSFRPYCVAWGWRELAHSDVPAK